MSERIHALAQSLLGKRSIDECSIDEIKTIVNKYPYFAPAQFLLLEKLKQEDKDSYQRQFQKAVLYYHNPAGFEPFLSSGKFWINKEEEDIDTADDFSWQENARSPGVLEEPKDLEETYTTSYSEEAERNEEIPLDVEPTETEVAEQDGENETVYEQTESEPAIDLTPVSAGSLNEVYPPMTEPVAGSGAENEQTEANSEPIDVGEEEKTKEAPVIESIGSAEITGNTQAVETDPGTVKKEPEDASTGFVFEPYHTVDYFASQGIKAITEEAPKDKFGKQLRSFTDWLKTMKKLPANEPPRNLDSKQETKVVSLANQSVNDSDIVTEAMAEVWLKQGNKQKALEIYNKLVLLDPSKKAFFASKIENLKNPS